jgi:hypothetical protein
VNLGDVIIEEGDVYDPTNLFRLNQNIVRRLPD